MHHQGQAMQGEIQAAQTLIGQQGRQRCFIRLFAGDLLTVILYLLRIKTVNKKGEPCAGSPRLTW